MGKILVRWIIASLALFLAARIIPGPQGLDNVVVAVVENSGSDAPLLRRTRALGVTPVIIPYPDYYSALAGLQNESVGAVVGPHRQLQRLAAGVSDLGITPMFTRDPLALGLPKNDAEWRDLINATLMGLFEDGSYQRLFAEWFEEQTVPPVEVWPASSHLTLDKLSATLPDVGSTIETIQGRGMLVAGLVDNRFPLADFDENNVARGFEAEIVRALAGRWLGDVSAVQFVNHTPESGIAALQNGQIDLLAGALPHTLADESQIDFSQTFYQDGIGLLVLAEVGRNDLASLRGGVVAVPADSATSELLNAAARNAGISLSSQSVAGDVQAINGLNDRSYQAYADLRSRLLGLAYANGGLLVLDARLTERPLAFGLRQGDSQFRDLLNFTLQELAADGSFAGLYAEWFGSDPPYPLEIWLGQPYLSLELSTVTAP